MADFMGNKKCVICGQPAEIIRFYGDSSSAMCEKDRCDRKYRDRHNIIDAVYKQK